VETEKQRPVTRNEQKRSEQQEKTMAISDPIADMLTRVRNAAKAKFNSVDVPGSTLKIELAKILKNEGYIRNYKFLKDGKQGILRIYLKYGAAQSNVIYKIKRISKPSRRVYVKCKEIKPVYNGLGIAILSTSKGVMSDKKARQEKVGGEILCQVW
jgi:small subunit ribosomal protein S8